MRDGYVELIGLYKRFGTVEAVSDVTLAVPEAKVTTLLGPSGCGKTTLLRLIAGFIQPDRGDILIKGRRVNELPPQRRSSVVVFQDYALFPHLNVFENVAYGLRRRGMEQREIRRRVDEMLAFLGLSGRGPQSPLQLSGGQQQRVALARALVVEPDVLLLDEPLSNLDVKLRVRVRTELKEIQRSLGKTTILVTHDQEEALSISDRIAVLESGRIRQTGTPIEVYSRPADRFVADFVGIANFIPALVRAVRHGSLDLDSPLGALTGEIDGFQPGQAVTLVLRPTALRLACAPSDGWVRVAVHSTSFFGGFRRYALQLNELKLTADQPMTEAGLEGADAWMAVDQRAGFHLLPASEPAEVA
jgi:iron(III) transport system ATP-binding protein